MDEVCCARRSKQWLPHVVRHAHAGAAHKSGAERMRTPAPQALTATRAAQLSATFFHDPIASPSLVALEVYEEYAACRDFPVVQNSPRLRTFTARTVAGARSLRAPAQHPGAGIASQAMVEKGCFVAGREPIDPDGSLVKATGRGNWSS